MMNMMNMTGSGPDVRPVTTGVRLRLRGDLAPGATTGILFAGINSLGLAAIR